MAKSKLSVCLVDDDAAVRNSFKLLMNTAGYKFTSFGSARNFFLASTPRMSAA